MRVSKAKLNKWKKRVKEIRERNRRNKVYWVIVRLLELPTKTLTEGEIPQAPRLIFDAGNKYREVIMKDIEVIRISGRSFYREKGKESVE